MDVLLRVPPGGFAGFALASLLFAAGPAQAESGPPTLEECDARVRDEPRDPLSYYCYMLSVRAHGRSDEAVQRLEAILALQPDLHRVKLFLAYIESMRGAPRADELLREAYEGLVAVGDDYGVVYGGLTLSDRLREEGRAEEADAILSRALSAAEATEDAAMMARVWVGQAVQAKRRGDQRHALLLLDKAEATVFPEGPFDLQCAVLNQTAAIYWYLRDFREAIEVYRREIAIKEAVGDLFGLASTWYNIAFLSSELAARGEIPRQEYEALLPETLEVARRGGDLTVEGRVQLLVGEAAKGEAKRKAFESALDLGRRGGDRELQWMARRGLAEELVRSHPERFDGALAMVAETVEEAKAAGSVFHVARGTLERAYLVALHRSREEAVRAYREALDVVETIRTSEPEETMRARVLSRWDFAYYRLAGFLLQGLEASVTPEEDLDLALRTMERFRARVLLEAVEATGADTGPISDPLRAAREELLARISAVQRGLSDPALPDLERADRLETLEELETQEMELRHRIARADPDFALLHAPVIPSLDEIRADLGEDQALLSFQLWGRDDFQGREIDDGASWLLVVTREDTRVVPLPDRKVLATRVGILEGLLANRDGSEISASIRLYSDLLGEALDLLPSGIRRLVLVPDHALHRCPFGALREHETAPPLAARYDISFVPSVTLWHRWRHGSTRPSAPSAVLAVAAPDLTASELPEAWRTADPWIQGLRAGSLPHARREARELARRLGSGSRVLAGPEASEHRLKHTDLSDYGVLHLATHAVVDLERPERSSVLLTPGAASEDGFLQAREIAELRLEGQVVILSTCRSASGALVGSEGLQGLARAFFRAGARTVVASLWPLRDDETELLMRDFARELGRGRSVAAALREAQGSRLEAGAPAAAWAGLIVLGDGDVVPVPGGKGMGRSSLAAVLLGTSALLALLLRLRGRRRRRA